MGFVNDFVNTLGNAASGIGSAFGDAGNAVFGGNGMIQTIFGGGSSTPLNVTTNPDPVAQTNGYSPYVDQYAAPPIMPGLGQYTRDPSTATKTRWNEFPGSASSPMAQVPQVHAPIIADPPRPVWTPWHDAIATGGWGIGPLGAGMGIPGAPEGTPFTTKSWIQPPAPHAFSAPQLPQAPASAVPSQVQQTWGHPQTAAAMSAGNGNAWSGSGNPTWRR